ncbi:MAG: hypothetical protein E7394_06640 [Ruminococcaceae bacterium]|nr:hypothetical protein [Oscillospiraceae bacterium]
MFGSLSQVHATIPTNNIGGDSSQVIIFLVVVVILFIILVTLKVYVPFFKRVRYFKMEMKRSDGEEYYYWKFQLRKLYRKYIPFASLFIRKNGTRRRR